jgi:very-short-patch-repair endonuclease
MKRDSDTRANAKALRTSQTPPERALWEIVRGNRLGVKFVRQIVIAPYIADFAARSERLVVELDGDSHAGSGACDAFRTAALEAKGWRVVRFTNSEILTNPEGVARSILIALGRDPESPRLL